MYRLTSCQSDRRPIAYEAQGAPLREKVHLSEGSILSFVGFLVSLPVLHSFYFWLAGDGGYWSYMTIFENQILMVISEGLWIDEIQQKTNCDFCLVAVCFFKNLGESGGAIEELNFSVNIFSFFRQKPRRRALSNWQKRWKLALAGTFCGNGG